VNACTLSTILIRCQLSVCPANCSLLTPLPLVPYDVQLWALQPGKPAKQQQHTQQQPNSSAAAAAGAWKHGTSAFGGAGAMDGMMSSSSGSESGDSSSDADSGSDDEGAGPRRAQFDSNNAVNSVALTATAAGLQRQPGVASVQQRMQRRARQQQQQLRLSAAWSVLEQQLALLHGQQQGVLVLATCQLPAEALPHEMQQLFGCSDQPQQQQQQQQCDSMYAASGDHYSSSGALVQTCCCSVSGSSNVTSASAAANVAALQCALDRAVAAATEQYRQQLTFARDHQTLDNNADCSNAGRTVAAAGASAHTQQAGGVAAMTAPSDGASTVTTVLQQQQQQTGTTAAAAAAAPCAGRRRPAGTAPPQQQQQQHQQQPVVSLQHLNAAQQAQAKHLFDQVS
jgi:hypothetical protein